MEAVQISPTSGKGLNLEILFSTAERWKLLPTPEMRLVALTEAMLLKGARDYLMENGFIEIVAPHITKATGACENIATMFELSYFGQRAYLSQTGQLYLEAMAMFLGKVWTVIQSFRAEPVADDRHLAEFTLIELEFLGGLEELLSHIEGIITRMVREALKLEDEYRRAGVDVGRLYEVKPPFERITYTEAVELLSDMGVRWGDDLKSVHEKAIVERLGGRPVLVTHYPKEIKFFNMRENDENPEIVNSVDLLLPFSGEAVGGAEREYRYERLLKRLLESQMLKMLIERGGSVEDFDWYLNIYKTFGGRLHSGCGIGLNRVTQFVLGLSDIRGTTIFPLNRESLM